MAEELLDLRGVDRELAYATLVERTASVLDGIDDVHAAMATIACLVHHGFGHLWTGFYRVVEPGRLLRVGAYQGSLGCLEIAYGRGVCGTAASTGKSLVVPDVHAFPGHIACDALALQIVVPVFDRAGALLAVFDVDSAEPAAFDERDRLGLERLLGWFAR